MKSAWGKISVSILLLGFALGTSAQDAASGGRTSSTCIQTATFNVHVPFSFQVGSQILPAGSYRVQRLMGRPTVADESGVIVLRGITVPVYETVLTRLVDQPAGAESRSHLVFGSQAGRHILSEVRIEGEKRQQIPVAEMSLSDAEPQEPVVAETHR